MHPASYADRVLPEDAARAALVGRVFDPEQGGPCVVALREDTVVDLSAVEPTVSDLLERDDAVEVVRSAPGGTRWPLRQLLDATLASDNSAARFLAPNDLHVLKAAGVTFVRSMLERVIEERAEGDPMRAEEIRAKLADAVGGVIAQVRPGSPEAARVKEVLIGEGLWSQYLEVGIGPDPEIFTKAPVLSAVGLGAQIGVLARSSWNNPEPELVLAVTSRGVVVGATLGNDVNLRDFEGRSALLLTEAKDNNASCAVGPFIRLFDDTFSVDDAGRQDITLRIDGPEGYVLEGVSSVGEISRDPLELVTHTLGAHHQYPDGFMLFTGTMFAPTEDRDQPGQGFTHKRDDVVAISSPRLGTLVNTVSSAEDAPDWTFGVRALMRNLATRGLLAAPATDRTPT
ncbi:MAG TPA: fumarylacetoacetate hydrolase family protein [Actinoallomurus sp.]